MHSLIFQEKLINSLEVNKDLIAIEENGQQISYAELSIAANKITSCLQHKKIVKGTIIGISVENKFQLISSMIGIANARCIFVPLDFTLPDLRLDEMIQSMELNYIVISKEGKYGIPLKNLEHIYIEDVLVSEASLPAVFENYEEEDSLYIYFTSGTTGKPKGIIGKNCSLLQFLEWEIDKFNFISGIKFSQLISPYFDAFLRDIFAPLLSGGTICVPKRGEDFFSEEILTSWIDEYKINIIHCVPSVFRVINHEKINSTVLLSLTHVLLSGERVVPSELINWYDVFGSRIKLVNLYGTTETTMVRAFYEIVPDDVKKSKIPIGSPIADTIFIISNGDFKPCKPLVTGDLYIVSRFLTKGYLNDPILNAEKFITLYEGTLDEVKAFKTGDKARILADGKIDLLGREDRQVKIRGIRIELEEIEHFLLQSPLIKSAIVVNNTNTLSKDQSIIAFVIRKNDISIAEPIHDLLKKFLSNYLQVYMIPTEIIEVSEYPTLSNGKTNIKALLDLLTIKSIVLPINGLEAELLIIWKEIFGDKAISTMESFQAIGGNSLSILALVSKIYKSYNIRLSLSQIFNNQTIQKQAVLIDKQKKDSEAIIKKSDSDLLHNLSSNQSLIFKRYGIDKMSTRDNSTIIWKIKGELDKNRIEFTFRLLLKRHKGLTTIFQDNNSVITQTITNENEFILTEILEKDFNSELVDQFIFPFDLNKSPLIRAAITPDNMLLIDVHQIVCDHTSETILLSDFNKLYNGNKLATLKFDFIDYAEWEYNLKKNTDIFFIQGVLAYQL